MYLFEIGIRPWEVKCSTPEETAEMRRYLEVYEAFCYMTVANQLIFKPHPSSTKKES